MLGERQVEKPRAVRQPLAGDDTHDAVVRIEPHGRNVAVSGVGADHRDRPSGYAGDMAHVVADPSRTPLGQEVGRASLHGGQDLTQRARRLEGLHLGYLAVGPAHPDTVTDRQLHLALPLDSLLDALALWQLEQHPLLAPRHATLSVRVIEGEALIDDEVADLYVGDPSHECLDRAPGILPRCLWGTRAERGEDDRQDEGTPHGCGYNALVTQNANERSTCG